MDQRTAYLLQILETIGTPLLQAAIEGGAKDDGALCVEAQNIAALLGKTVEASIELGNIMEINPAEAQDDTLRVALAGLAGPLVAGQFRKRGRVPESPDLKKITNALQAVLTFSDNFTPTPETVERLKNLEASGQVVDGYQSQIQYIQAFVPVVEAVSAFPFGQPEAKLIMDVSDRLVKKSVEVREALLPGQNDEALQKRAELAILKALADVYASCHKHETQKAMNAKSETPASIDAVWSAFDMRAAILESLAGNIAPEGQSAPQSASSGGVAPVATTAPAETPQQPPPASPPAPPQTAPEQPPAAPPAAPATPPPAAETPVQPVQPQTPVPPPQEQAPPPQQPQSNPMAMFAKPKTDGADGAAQPAAPTTPPPVVPPTPPSEPPAAPPAAPATPPPPPAEAPQQPPPAENPQEQQGQGGGNPMSFFKKKDEEE